MTSYSITSSAVASSVVAMVKGYCGHFGIKLAEDELEREALEWSTTRGARSGRVAWQFTQELAGRLGVRLKGK